MFCIVCRKYQTVADKASQLYVGINRLSTIDFHRDSLVSHTCVFNKLKMKKNQSRYCCSE